MQAAWDELQKTQTKEAQQAAIEARVRYGAVRGAEQAENIQTGADEVGKIVEGNDEDLDDAVFDV